MIPYITKYMSLRNRSTGFGRSHLIRIHSVTTPIDNACLNVNKIKMWRGVTCAEPGIFLGGPEPDGQKTVWTTVFYSPRLILQFTERVEWLYYRENNTFPRIQRCPSFSRGGGSNFFQGGGVQMLISIETHITYITCDFQGWVGSDSGTPIPPLDPQLFNACNLYDKAY